MADALLHDLPHRRHFLVGVYASARDLRHASADAMSDKLSNTHLQHPSHSVSTTHSFRPFTLIPCTRNAPLT